MRVLFAMDTFPYYGTSESLLFATKLQERGHDVLVCTSNRTTDGGVNSRSDLGVPVKYLPSFRVPKMPYVVTPISFPEMLLTIKNFEPDVVMAMHYVHFTTNMTVLASHQLRIPTILGIRGPGVGFGAPVLNALKKTLSSTIGRATIGMSKMVIFDCFASRRAYLQDVPDSKSAVVYSPVDTRKFVPMTKGDEPLTITFIGSLTPTKGLVYLMMALPRVLARFPDVRVWIAGDGILRKKLQAMAPPSVSFLGYRNDIVNILNRSDISVLPSVSEGVSNSLLEAGACGMACVASNVGGSPEIIDDGENGFLFPSKDSGALADRLIQLCENSGLRAMFGKNLRRKVEQQFDIEPVITKLEYVAKSVVS